MTPVESLVSVMLDVLRALEGEDDLNPGYREVLVDVINQVLDLPGVKHIADQFIAEFLADNDYEENDTED